MKSLQSITNPVEMLIYGSAIYLLLNDPRSTSFWVALLLLANLALFLIHLAKGISLLLKQPAAMMGNGASNKEVIDSICGTRSERRMLEYACRASVIGAGVYMIWADQGLRGCGEVFFGIVLINIVMHWLDSTTSGRKVATRLGIPLTPEDEAIID